jgi:RNA polymerase sigma-70 factor (ECF subfamily)
MLPIPFNRKLKDKSDHELLTKYLQNKSMDVLGELFGRYMHLVYGLCLKYFKNRDDSKDAVMQLFEKVASEVHKHEINNFKNWLYVVSKNYCLMEIRRNKHKIKMQHDENIFVFMENKLEIHPIDKEHDLNLEQALFDCIDRLKVEQKKCIRLFYFDNKCYREIASDLNFEEKKIKSFIQNGKRNLKICLENKK